MSSTSGITSYQEQQENSPVLKAHLLQSSPLNLQVYETLYKHFHSHPEVSLQEAQTASTIANHPALKSYTVHSSIGGHGLVAILQNGAAGPTVLLRAEMDALFVEEKTGLASASCVKMRDGADGSEKSVMHACGHDMHMTCALAAADWLAKDEVRDNWRGTLMILFQPSEERGDGARAMVSGGLYNKIPVPDVLLGQHLMPMKAGKVAVKSGTIMAACDSFKVTLFGRGGHGSVPHLCIDPVLLAANVIQRLQAIVSREVDPQEVAVLTIGSVQVGHTENVIADEAVLKIDIRSQSPATREKVLKAMKRIVEKVRWELFDLNWGRLLMDLRNARSAAVKNHRCSKRLEDSP